MTVKIKDNTLKFFFSLKDYPLEVLYGASYVFIDRAYIFLDSQIKDKIEVSLKGKKKLDKKQLEELKGEFLNELLNYTLRINLAKNNKKLREFIVGQALISAYGDDDFIKEDKIKYEDDPLGIAVSWEEKYGKEK
ncbi:MAG: His-Xaa-Ser system protein HxsD [Candidatus Portnoybacteria bacterium]|nr:His-Xaa-Ser system protein HxsD [Candidatus Portnoybacteria bacterium]